MITPSLKQGGINEVVYCKLSPEEADEVIDRTIAEYRANGSKFRWPVPPDVEPHDLGARLEKRGFKSMIIRALARPTGPLEKIATDPKISVEEVDLSNVDHFTQMIARGWGMDPVPLDVFHRALLSSPERRHHLFLARYGGEPAGASNMAMFPRSMFMQGAVTVPEYRGRGIYRAMVETRLELAAARGVPLATIHANAATSAPILAKLGFKEVVSFPFYTWSPTDAL